MVGSPITGSRSRNSLLAFRNDVGISVAITIGVYQRSNCIVPESREAEWELTSTPQRLDSKHGGYL